MTEKRFTNVNKDIFQYGEWWCSAGGEHCADVIATALNEHLEQIERLKRNFRALDEVKCELAEENERLKSENIELTVDNKELKCTNNELYQENEQLKQSVNNLKDTIIKITIAYQRKYDRTIVDLVDEVYEEDITDLIKELKE